MAPGPKLGVLLGGLTISVLAGTDLVEVLRARARQLSPEQAQLLAAMVEVGLCDPHAGLDEVARLAQAPEYAADEIWAALAWTRNAASREYHFAQTLLARLPTVFTTLDTGAICRGKVWLFTELTDEQTQAVCEWLLPAGGVYFGSSGNGDGFSVGTHPTRRTAGHPGLDGSEPVDEASCVVQREPEGRPLLVLVLCGREVDHCLSALLVVAQGDAAAVGGGDLVVVHAAQFLVTGSGWPQRAGPPALKVAGVPANQLAGTPHTSLIAHRTPRRISDRPGGDRPDHRAAQLTTMNVIT